MWRQPRNAATLLAAMLVVGIGVYRGLGHFKHLADGAASTGANPVGTTAQVSLPGTLYVSQGGDLFALHGSDFQRVIAHDDGGAWVQPAVMPTGDLLIVDRHDASSDIVQMSRDGTRTTPLLTGSAAPRSDKSLEDNHWYFTPRASPDGRSVWLSYDEPKQGYMVDLAVWSLPMPAADGTSAPATGPALPDTALQWTTPQSYTGGDVDPLPLLSGGVVFTRYSIDGTEKVHSQLWYTATAGTRGHGLTDAAQDCSGAALSPDGTRVAMVCTGGDQVARLEVAPLVPGATGLKLGAPRVLVDGTLAAQPVWAPDGSGLAYLAPAETGGGFQLWWVAGAATSSPAAPAQVTTSLGLDATSRPAWVAG